MNKYQLLFLRLLESELSKTILPATNSELSRRSAGLSAQELKRIVLEETIVSPLKKVSLGRYRALMPTLKEKISSELHGRLNQLIEANLHDWDAIDQTLGEITGFLLARNDASSRKLVGRLINIDSSIRDAKEKAWSDLNKAASSGEDEDKAAAAPDTLNSEQQSKLLAFLKQRYPKETKLNIAQVKLLTGGFSKQTLFIDLQNTVELPAGLVIRRDSPHFTGGTSVTMEFPVIEKMHAAGVAVPKPYGVDATGEILGTPFMILSRVEGSILGDFLNVYEPSRPVALNLAEQIAKLHSVPVDDMRTLYGGDMSVRDRLLDEIGKQEAVWHGVKNHRAYVVQATLDWLKQNIELAEGPRSVVHRDIGVHNVLMQGDKVGAFLDWETVCIGTPAEDLGFVYYQIVQMADWKDFMATYAKASNITISSRQLDFYILWASVRVAISIYRMVDPVFSGERESLMEYYLGDYFGETLMQRIAAKLSEVLAE